MIAPARLEYIANLLDEAGHPVSLDLVRAVITADRGYADVATVGVAQTSRETDALAEVIISQTLEDRIEDAFQYAAQIADATTAGRAERIRKLGAYCQAWLEADGHG